MRFCIYNAYEQYNHRDAIFDPKAYSIGEGLERPFVRLREDLRRLGHSLETIDMRPRAEFDGFVFLDYPEGREPLLESLKISGKRLILVILECEMLKPANVDSKNHRYFDRVFTYNPVAARRHGLEHSPIPYEFAAWPASSLAFKDRSLAVLIASNKICHEGGELYSERLRAIRWFERNAPLDFSLYGRGWDLRIFEGNRIGGILNRSTLLRRILAARRPSFKGELEEKHGVLASHRFCICYENASIPGYVTEKLLDCLSGGCIPVYLGAPDIESYVPRRCFIDKRDYDDYGRLFSALTAMGEDEYSERLRDISRFIESFESNELSSKAFARRIATACLDE